jgi:hypothetical protein
MKLVSIEKWIESCRRKIWIYTYAGLSIDVSGRSISREGTHVSIVHQHWHNNGVIGGSVII